MNVTPSCAVDILNIELTIDFFFKKNLHQNIKKMVHGVSVSHHDISSCRYDNMTNSPGCYIAVLSLYLL